MNAYFEDHAEHEYMKYVAENPALEQMPFERALGEDYRRFTCLADLFARSAMMSGCISWRTSHDSGCRAFSNAERSRKAARIVADSLRRLTDRQS